jgi:predicted phosphodiesterase
MVKIAIVSDIHGNAPALEAVLADAWQQNVDLFVFAGDYVFDLGYPNQVTETLRRLPNAVVVKGNKEGYLRTLLSENPENWTQEQMGAVYQTFRELSTDNLKFLVGLPEISRITLPFHGTLLVTHAIAALHGKQKKTGCSSSKFKQDMLAQPFTHNQFLTAMSEKLQEADFRETIADLKASVVVIGHSHLQWHGYCGDTLVINPGACGQPLDFNTCAPYAILEDTDAGLHVQERRVFYDIEETIRCSRETEIYRKGRIWCDLVFLAIRTGADRFSDFFHLAGRIASERKETGKFFSNETWRAAGQQFFAREGGFLSR